MTYTEAAKALQQIEELLVADGNFNKTYTNQWRAIKNRVELLATMEKKVVPPA